MPYGSSVDESLFGESHASRVRKRNFRNAGRRAARQDDDTSAIQISRQRYEAMKRRALSFAEEANLRKQAEAEARAAKKRNGPDIAWIPEKKPTVEEEYARRKRATGSNPANVRAKAMMDEELDEVKTLKHKLNLMKVKSIRDAQVHEKIARREKEENYDAHFRRVAQEERDAAIYAAEQQQIRLRERKKQYAAELTEQKMEMERRKILENEALEQEKLAMKAKIQQMLVEDREAEEKKVREQRRRNEVLAAANLQARRYRVERAAEAAAEDRRIMQYLAMKEYEEEKRNQAALALKKEKDAEVARLRGLQEKANDKRGEEDEKRAKRNQRERALADEAKYQKRIDDRKEMMRIVVRDRDIQLRLKARDERLQMIEDKKYMARIALEAAEIEERAAAERRRKHEINMRHGVELAALRDRRAKQKRDKILLQREKDARQALDGEVYRHRVDEVFRRKLAEHQSAGHALPPEFTRKEESEEEKRARRTKFSTSRDLW
jgi:hypothetical protein